MSGVNEGSHLEIMSKEAVRKPHVEGIVKINPLVDSLPFRHIDNGNGEKVVDISPLLIGANLNVTRLTQLTGTEIEQYATATKTMGRAVAFLFKWESPGVKIENNDYEADPEKKIQWDGVDIKGGGQTFIGQTDAQQTWRGLSMFGENFHTQRVGSTFANKESLDLGPSGQGDMQGGCNLSDVLEEYEDSLLLSAMGARVPMPLFVAKIGPDDEAWGKRISEGAEYGIIARASRTFFNWADLISIPSNRPDITASILNDAMSHLSNEGLLPESEYDQIKNIPDDKDNILKKFQEMSKLYLKIGAQTMGGDLAIIHSLRAIGNRNLQNTSTVFEHRDVSDYELKFQDMLGEKTAKKINYLFQNEAKFNDIFRELINFKIIVSSLIGTSNTNSEQVGEVWQQYLQSYFDKGQGLSLKTFKQQFHLHVASELPFMLSSKVVDNEVTDREKEIKLLSKVIKQIHT